VKNNQNAKASKPKTASTSKKIPGKFSRLFGNRKAVVLVAFVLIFAVFGSYRLYMTSAATKKDIRTCRQYTFRRGSTGGCVYTIQRLLNAFNRLPNTSWPSLAEDGQFGPATENSVRVYQRSRGTTVDGIVGPQTWSALQNDCRIAFEDYGMSIDECATYLRS
jgi:hypothetical protein